MTTPLRALIVEDSPDDAELMTLRLSEEGFRLDCRRVDNEPDYVAALESPPDLILADWRLPRFSGLRALQLMRERGLDIPFVIVSGSIGEETAIDALRQGAYDYVLKDRPARLGQAVRHALEDKRLREERRIAEAALHKSEQRYRSLFENIPIGLYRTTPDGQILHANPALVEMLGYPDLESLTAVSAADVYVDPADRAQEQALLERKGGVHHFETQMRRCDGVVIWVRDTLRVIRGADGWPLYYEGSLEDITERKRAEEDLRRLGQFLDSVIDNANIWLDVLNQEANIVIWNKAAEGISGYSREEVVGHGKIWEWLYPDEEYRNRVMVEAIAIIEKGGEEQDAETTIRRKDGQTRVMSWNSRQLVDQKGTPAGSIALGRDITERKRAEEALRESEERYRVLFEQARDGIALADTDTGIILDCNQALADLVGRNRAELIGQHQSILHLPSSDNTGFSPTFRQHMTDQEGQVLETQVLTRTGEIREVEIKANLLYLQGRRMLQGIFHDITERKQAEEEIRRHVRYLATLHEIDRALTSTLDLGQVLSTLLEQVRKTTDAEAASIALVEAGTGALVFRQAVGGAAQAVIGLRLKPGQGVAGWAVEHRQLVLVPDAASDPRFFGDVNHGTGFVTRDIVAVPLIARDTITGVVELLNKRGGTFGEDDVRLLESVTAQAAIAIENARLFEAERAGRQRLETLYRIGQTINSTLNASAILDRLTEEAMRATRATHGSALVARPETDCFERRSLRGYSPEQAERARRLPLSLRQGVNGRAYRTQQVTYLSDVQGDPDYFPLIPETRSELAVPFLRGGQVLGNLDLQSPEVDAFQDVDLGFLQALTDQVAIALENARLFQEARRRLDELSVVSNVALVGAAGRPFDEAVSRATAAMSTLWPDSNISFLFLDETEQMLRLHPSSQRVPPELIASLRIPLNQGITSWAARERQPVRVGDVTADQRYIVGVPGARSEMAAPLLVGERVIGVVNVESPRPDAFSGEDLRLLTTLAGQLATIFEKARLDAALAEHIATLEQRVEERTVELRAANEQLRQAHIEVSRALEKEKELGELKSRFISMTSHEFRTPLSVILSSSELLEHYGVKWAEEKRLAHLRRIQAAVNNMIQLLDDVLIIGREEAGKLDFTPAPLNLVQFCSDLVEEVQLSAGTRHTIAFVSQGESADAQMDERLLRQILVNLLSNAIKYSPQGGTVRFELVCREEAAIFRVGDEGIGIPPEDQAHLFETFHRARNVGHIPGTGLGLTIVKKSVDLHGGTITVDSQIGVGTTFTVTLPIRSRGPS